MGIFLVVFFGIIFGTYLVTPIYEATARILIHMNPQQQLILFNDLVTPAPTNISLRINPANNLIEISRSKSIAEKIVKTFGLDRPKETQGARESIKNFLSSVLLSPITLMQKLGLLRKKKPDYLSEAVEKFMEDMEDIQLQEDTEIINLVIWAEDPKLASDIANTMAELLVEKLKEMTQTEAGTAYEFTKQQLKIANQSLQEAEEALMSFKNKERIAFLDEEKEIKLNRLNELEAEYHVVSVDLREIQQELLYQEEGSVSDIVIKKNPIIYDLATRVNELESELASVRQKFTEEHPVFISLKAEISENKDKLNKEIKSTVNALNARKNALKDEISVLKRELVQIAEKEIELTRLMRNIETNEERFMTLKNKLLELEVQKVTNMSEFDIQIIDAAHIPEGASPDKPIWPLNIAVGLFASIIIGLGFAFFAEYWNDSLKTNKEIEEHLELPVLGSIPDIRKKGTVKG